MRYLAVAAAIFVSLVTGANAADFGAARSPAPSATPRSWDLIVGGGVRLQPAFEGSDRIIFSAVPLVSLSRTGSVARFTAADDGISLGVVDENWIRFGPTLRFNLPRHESANRRALTGLGDVDFALEPGLFVNLYPTPWLRLRAEVRHGWGGHEGWVGDLSADFYTPLDQTWRFAIGPRLSFGSQEFFDPYFGVNALQSMAARLPMFSPDGGLRSVGAGASIGWTPAPRWEATLYAEYQHLVGEAARSPLVRLRGSEEQLTVGVNVTYRFSLGDLGF